MALKVVVNVMHLFGVAVKELELSYHNGYM